MTSKITVALAIVVILLGSLNLYQQQTITLLEDERPVKFALPICGETNVAEVKILQDGKLREVIMAHGYWRSASIFESGKSVTVQYGEITQTVRLPLVSINQVRSLDYCFYLGTITLWETNI